MFSCVYIHTDGFSFHPRTVQLVWFLSLSWAHGPQRRFWFTECPGMSFDNKCERKGLHSVYFITCHLADAFIQRDLQSIRLSRGQTPLEQGGG